MMSPIECLVHDLDHACNGQCPVGNLQCAPKIWHEAKEAVDKAHWCDRCVRDFMGYGYMQDASGQHTDEGVMRWCNICGTDCSFTLYDDEGAMIS
jgi:hypothetical protein